MQRIVHQKEFLLRIQSLPPASSGVSKYRSAISRHTLRFHSESPEGGVHAQTCHRTRFDLSYRGGVLAGLQIHRTAQKKSVDEKRTALGYSRSHT